MQSHDVPELNEEELNRKLDEACEDFNSDNK